MSTKRKPKPKTERQKLETPAEQLRRAGLHRDAQDAAEEHAKVRALIYDFAKPESGAATDTNYRKMVIDALLDAVDWEKTEINLIAVAFETLMQDPASSIAIAKVAKREHKYMCACCRRIDDGRTPVLP